MSPDRGVREAVASAAAAVSPVWPLHSFVTANPLAGFEDRPFHDAVGQAGRLFGGRGYPDPDLFRQALDAGRIDPDILAAELDAAGYDADPVTLLDRMDTADRPTTTATDRVDTLLTKWLSAFLDQGQADWPMPEREAGFYAAFRSVARHDRAIPGRSAIADLPSEPAVAVEQVVAEFPAERWPRLFEAHLTAVPGWAGLIKRRATDETDWGSTCPVTLLEYLAVRLTLVDLLDAPVDLTADSSGPERDDEPAPLAAVWLTAWERTYRTRFLEALPPDPTGGDPERPDAQLVFCIDTRSERIRRHVEAAGAYETHGYAGFFGVPMRYQGYDDDVTADACPPVVDAKHRITDRPTGSSSKRVTHDRWSGTVDALDGLFESLKSNAATAFNFVEGAAPGYGVGLLARTLLPARVGDLRRVADEQVPDAHEFCAPAVDRDPGADRALPAGLTLAERVEYAATAFDLMGWTGFAPVVGFIGHASQTTNNPFDASLDCGACAGNPGGPNARVLATICNDDAVQTRLRDRGFDIPEDTVFVAGEHNTTTDEIVLYTDNVPASHTDDIERLRQDLGRARAGAASERVDSLAGTQGSGTRETERRAADWAETRPEWGLAGNAALFVGPRAFTADLDLDGRVFLHSYDWQTDPDGDALTAILTGPMVVTQWINTQYYFATVDTAVYGSGSKVTHNPVGNVGVYQGNGGDLMTGLPLQSLKRGTEEFYHQPLRLSAVVHAPVDRVTDILAENDHLQTLLDNDWLSLTVLDPQNDAPLTYDSDLHWTPVSVEQGAETGQVRSSTVDD